MKLAVRIVVFFLIVQLCNEIGFAQQSAPFYNEIQAFKKQDSINPPAKGAILFVGSSSFRGWTNVQEYFPKHKIISRALKSHYSNSNK